MGQWKRRSSLALKNLFQTKLTGYGAKIDLDGPMWQPKYHVFNVFSLAKAREKLAYMHNNPVTAGLVQRAENWRFSFFGIVIQMKLHNRTIDKARSALKTEHDPLVEI